MYISRAILNQLIINKILYIHSRAKVLGTLCIEFQNKVYPKLLLLSVLGMYISKYYINIYYYILVFIKFLVAIILFERYSHII
jgi:hypothetical protein